MARARVSYELAMHTPCHCAQEGPRGTTGKYRAGRERPSNDGPQTDVKGPPLDRPSTRAQMAIVRSKAATAQ